MLLIGSRSYKPVKVFVEDLDCIAVNLRDVLDEIMVNHVVDLKAMLISSVKHWELVVGESITFMSL